LDLLKFGLLKGLLKFAQIRILLGRPIKLFGRHLPKIWLWRGFLQLGRVLDAAPTHRLLQCIVCYVICSRLQLEQLNIVPEQEVRGPILDTEDNVLAQCSTMNTPRFLPDLRRGKVTSVYDGDTLTVAARHSGRGSAYRFTLRLLGIDTPEINGASADEKRVARAARDVLSEMVLGEMVKIDVSAGFDKYGRLLAVVTHDIHGDVAQVLLQKGYAEEYDGGKRRKW